MVDHWANKPADWLVEYVEKSTGAKLKVTEEGKPVKGNICCGLICISIANTKSLNLYSLAKFFRYGFNRL